MDRLPITELNVLMADISFFWTPVALILLSRASYLQPLPASLAQRMFSEGEDSERKVNMYKEKREWTRSGGQLRRM